MNRNILFTALLFGAFYLAGCTEEHNEPSDKDTVPPQALAEESISVESMPGGAIIKYKLPDEADLLAVEARYKISSGQEYKVRVSYLLDSLVVDGYLEVREYPVELYVVDRSENYSPPVIVNITPDTAPLHTIFGTLGMSPDFGGVVVSWENPTKASIAIFLLREDDDGELVEVDTYYTNAQAGQFAVRGMEAEETKFSLQIRDKWQNYSDYYTQTLTPLFEEELDYDKFSVMDVRYSDNLNSTDANGLSDLWTRTLHVVDKDHLTSISSTVVPWSASFSIGEAAKLSRIVIWQYGWAYNSYAVFYTGGNARTWEFYGSNAPSEDGSLDDTWTLFLTADITKPSGEPYNAGTAGMTEEDFDIAMNRGHEFMVPITTPKFKYIRMRCARTFDGGSQYGHSYRIQMFGDYNVE